MNVRAICVGVILRARERDLRSQPPLLLKLRLQILGRFGERGVVVAASQANPCTSHACDQCLQAMVQRGGFFSIGSHNVQRSELGCATQLAIEHKIGQPVRGVHLDFRVHLCQKVPLLAKEGDQRLPVLLDIGRIERGLRLEVGHLHEPRIVESLRPRELKEPKVDRRLQDEQHPNPVRLRIHLHTHVLGLSAGLQRGQRAIYLVGRKRFTRLLNKQRLELRCGRFRTPGHFNRRYILPLIAQKNLRIGRRTGRRLMRRVRSTLSRKT